MVVLRNGTFSFFLVKDASRRRFGRQLRSRTLDIPGRSMTISVLIEDREMYQNRPAIRLYGAGSIILEASFLAPKVKRFVVRAPLVAARHQAGHFVIVRFSSDGERIPLTIADSDSERGTITLIVQAVGASTEQICRLSAGDSLHDLAGPLGTATELGNYGHVVLVGGGVGAAVLYPQACSLRAFGNQVTAIIGGRSRDYVIMETELKQICSEVHVCTDDGSYGYHGFVTGKLKQLIDDRAVSINRVLTAGPLPMMKAVSDCTRAAQIPTLASLVTIMVDGTGMCGGCRVTVAGELRFACVHGPEFDAHQVNFDELMDRLKSYQLHEKVAHAKERSAHICRLRPAMLQAGRVRALNKEE
jgi:NAD(P)H-flavin reductase